MNIIINHQTLDIQTGKFYRLIYYKEDLNRASLNTEELYFYSFDNSIKFTGKAFRFINFTQDFMKFDSVSGTYIVNTDFWRLIRTENIVNMYEIEIPEELKIDCGDYITTDKNIYSGEHTISFK